MKKLSILMLAAVLASACKKDKHNPRLNGTYTGSFRETTAGATQQPGPFCVQLIMSGEDFHTGQGTTYIPMGDGSVQISTGVLNFTNKDVFPDNTAYNSSAVLGGNYNYTVKGDSLLFSKTELNVTYYLQA